MCGCNPAIGTSGTALDFGFDVAVLSFEVWNAGDPGSVLEWKARADGDWVDLAPGSGRSTGALDRTAVRVSIDRPDLAAGSRVTAEIEISAEGGGSKTVLLTADVGLEVAARDLAPRMVYLSWEGDTSTTMTVSFQTETDDEEVLAFMSPVVYYSQDPLGAAFEGAESKRGESVTIGALDPGKVLHTVRLTELDPGASYHFVGRVELLTGAVLAEGEVLPETAGSNKFRTVRAGGTIRFVTGGDMDLGGDGEAMLRIMASLDPMFALIGGDIVYPYFSLDSPTPDVALSEQEQWEEMLEQWDALMRTSDGHMIPMVLAIGNHDADYTDNIADELLQLNEGDGYFSQGAGEITAPFYLRYVPQANRSYFARTFGSDLVIYVLDSGHITPHGGEQLEWLEGALAANAAFRHQFAVYHVPLYPSHRRFDLPVTNPGNPSGLASAAGRAAWGPAFYGNNMDTAFENHDHLHKRTVRLRYDPDAVREYVPDPGGTLFLGDGSLGRPPRVANGEVYLASSTPVTFAWLVVTEGPRVTYQAIDSDGCIIDECVTVEDENGAFTMDCSGEAAPCAGE